MSQPESPRRKLRIGPGFVVAVLFAAFLIHRNGGLQETFQEPPEATQAQHLDVEPPPLGLTPELAWLLRRGDEVGLTPDQRAELEQQQTAYEQATAADRQQVEQASSQLGSQLDRSRETGVTRDQLTESTTDVSKLSASLATQREAAWSKAWDVLTEAQQQQVRELRQAAPTELR